MKQLARIGVLLLCLVLAIFSYSVGITAGFGFFLLIGILFEAVFWLGLFGKFKSRSIARK